MLILVLVLSLVFISSNPAALLPTFSMPSLGLDTTISFQQAAQAPNSHFLTCSQSSHLCLCPPPPPPPPMFSSLATQPPTVVSSNSSRWTSQLRPCPTLNHVMFHQTPLNRHSTQAHPPLPKPLAHICLIKLLSTDIPLRPIPHCPTLLLVFVSSNTSQWATQQATPPLVFILSNSSHPQTTRVHYKQECTQPQWNFLVRVWKHLFLSLVHIVTCAFISILQALLRDYI